MRCAVAWIEDRLENLTASFHSRDQRLVLRGAFAADGEFLALHADILCNIGAYGNAPITAAVVFFFPGTLALPPLIEHGRSGY